MALWSKKGEGQVGLQSKNSEDSKNSTLDKTEQEKPNFDKFLGLNEIPFNRETTRNFQQFNQTVKKLLDLRITFDPFTNQSVQPMKDVNRDHTLSLGKSIGERGASAGRSGDTFLDGRKVHSVRSTERQKDGFTFVF